MYFIYILYNIGYSKLVVQNLCLCLQALKVITLKANESNIKIGGSASNNLGKALIFLIVIV